MSLHGPCLQTVSAEINADGEWHRVVGYDVPMLYAPNLRDGMLRIFSGDEPTHDGPVGVDITERRINEAMESSGGRKWIFTPGQYRSVMFGPVR